MDKVYIEPAPSRGWGGRWISKDGLIRRINQSNKRLKFINDNYKCAQYLAANESIKYSSSLNLVTPSTIPLQELIETNNGYLKDSKSAFFYIVPNDIGTLNGGGAYGFAYNIYKMHIVDKTICPKCNATINKIHPEYECIHRQIKLKIVTNKMRYIWNQYYAWAVIESNVPHILTPKMTVYVDNSIHESITAWANGNNYGLTLKEYLTRMFNKKEA